MDKMLGNNHFKILNGENILEISKKANKARKEGNQIVDATIGMLFDDESNLASFDLVKNIIKEANDSTTLRYGGVTGDLEFQEGVKNWLFEGVNLEQTFVQVIATIGATGALSLSMRNYTNIKQEILVPSLRWSSYDNIASQAYCKIKEYNMFNGDDKLDLESIKSAVEDSINKYQRVYLLINDPCQNPTGYSMNYHEWEELLSYLKEVSKNYPVVLLDDIAYMNYSDASYQPIFQLMVDSLNDNLMIQIAFSASKTLSIYGLRGGALVGLSKNKETINSFLKISEETARSIWSMPNNIACKVIKECFKNQENRQEIKNQIDKYKAMINNRAKIFLEEAELVDLINYNYVNGFFVLIPCLNSLEVVEKLMEEDVYVVPMGDGLRISLASVPTSKIDGLAKKIKKAMTK